MPISQEVSKIHNEAVAIMDYQVLGQGDGTGRIIMFNSLPTYSLESY